MKARARAKKIFRRYHGVLRTRQALHEGIHPRTLYALRDDHEIAEVRRGVYRLVDMPPTEHLDLLVVSKSTPDAVVCLISALAFHDITNEIPHEVQIALPRTVRRPDISHPPVRVFRFSGEALTEGIEKHSVDGHALRIYSAAKTVADCFKFRNAIGIDVAIEGLRQCLEKRKATPGELLHYADICRVRSIIMPYLQALT